jgi:hypothetical protein
VLILERLVGLAGGPVPVPGLYMPEHMLTPSYFVEQMVEAGVTVRDEE